VFEQPSIPLQPEPAPIQEEESTVSEPIVTEEPEQEEQSVSPQIDVAVAAQQVVKAVSEAVEKIASLGLDMSPEAREQAQEALVAGVIVPQVAAQAAAVAASRRVK